MKSAQAREVRHLLKTTPLPQSEIAKQMGTSQKAISDINTGATWLVDGETYPLRARGHTVTIQLDNKCKTCGTPISSRAVQCVKCSNEARRLIERPTKEELKELLWATSIAEVARHYNVHRNTVMGWCKSYGLPDRAKALKQLSEEEWASL